MPEKSEIGSTDPLIEVKERVNHALSELSPDDARTVLKLVFASRIAKFSDSDLDSFTDLIAAERARREANPQDASSPPSLSNEDSLDVSLQGAGTKNSLVEVAPEESTEEHAQRLISHVERAEFGSFQEYELLAKKSENGFEVQYVGPERSGRRRLEPDDLLNTTQLKDLSARPSSVSSALEDFFGFSRKNYGIQQRMSVGTYLVVTGERDGKFIVQGGGRIHPDFAYRPGNYSSFKVVFDNREAMTDFVDWLKVKPNEALKSVFEPVMSRYDNDGHPVESLFPGGKFHNPFAYPIEDIRIRDLGKIEDAITPEIPEGSVLSNPPKGSTESSSQSAPLKPPLSPSKRNRFGIF